MAKRRGARSKKESDKRELETPTLALIVDRLRDLDDRIRKLGELEKMDSDELGKLTEQLGELSRRVSAIEKQSVRT
jgi:hypothetical protein